MTYEEFKNVEVGEVLIFSKMEVTVVANGIDSQGAEIIEIRYPNGTTTVWWNGPSGMQAALFARRI